jgi:hypothetical protein
MNKRDIISPIPSERQLDQPIKLWSDSYFSLISMICMDFKLLFLPFKMIKNEFYRDFNYRYRYL